MLITIMFRRLFYMVAVLCLSTATAQERPKALLLTGNGNANGAMEGYPPWMHEFHNEEVQEILGQVVDLHVTEDVSELNAANLRQYDLVISNSIFLTPSPEELEALYAFISEGKSLLTLHCGILSFLNWDRYEEVLGGLFIGGPAIEPERFEVSTSNMEFWGYSFPFRKRQEHPVSLAVDDFTIEDELYYFQPNKTDFDVIARANNHPVMWWHPVKKGKVMSLTLGHNREAKANPGYRELLNNGVRWLLDYPLIETIRMRPVSTREEEYTEVLPLKEYIHAPHPSAISLNLEGNSAMRITDPARATLGVRTMTPGDAEATLRVSDPEGRRSERTIAITILEDGQGNIASYHGNTAAASSTEPANYLFHPDHLIDGDLNTRWASGFTDPQWIQLDLQKPYDLATIRLHWEASYATAYTVAVSENGADWKTVAEVRNADGGVDTIDFVPEPARYIRITGTERARELFGYSLFEVEVYSPE